VAVDADLRSKLGITVQPAVPSLAGRVVSATGQLQVNEDFSWQVGAVTDGKIIAVPVGIGDPVKEGQVLAMLHSHEVHDARASYRQAVAELQRQKTLAGQALSVRDRTKRLFDLRAASREQLDAAETMYRSINASVSNAQAEVEKAEFHLTDFLEVSIDGKGHSDLASSKDALTIKSPASGTLMERKVTAGAVVSTGDPVFTVADLTRLWMIAAVNEAEMAHIHPGQRAEVSVRAFPDRKFPGRVSRLGERLDAQTRTLQVRVLVPNGERLLKPDMFATAEFPISETRKVIQVPESALHELNGKTVVFVQRFDGSYAPREVTPGVKGDGTVEIHSGIDAGDPVVVKGGFLLKSQCSRAPENSGACFDGSSTLPWIIAG
jgi:cobalt-zinc-cadmium efflux system membrane fusion protein